MTENIMQSLGAGLSGGAEMGAALLPLWMQGQQNQYAANEAERKRKAKEAKETKILSDLDVIGKRFLSNQETIEFDTPEQLNKTVEAVQKVFKDTPITQSGGVPVPAGQVTVQQFYDEERRLPKSYDASGVEIPADKHYGSQFKNKFGSDYGSAFGSFKKATAQVESGGKLSVLGLPLGNKSTQAGQKALGKYQIMPMHLPKIGLDPNKPGDIKKYLSSAGLQDKLFDIVGGEAFERAGGDPFWAAIYYYGMPKGADIDAEVPTAGGKRMSTRRGHGNKILKAMGLPENLGSGYDPTGGKYNASGVMKAVGLSAITNSFNAKSGLVRSVEERPQLKDIRNQLADKIESLISSPEYIKASPEARELFKKQIIDPYMELAKLEKSSKVQELSLFSNQIGNWGRNMRALYRGQMAAARKVSTSAERATAGRALSSIGAKIRRIESFQKNISTAKGDKRKELLRNFKRYTTVEKKRKIGPDAIWDVFEAIGVWDSENTEINHKAIAETLTELYQAETDITNKLMGIGSQTLSGGLDDIDIDSEIQRDELEEGGYITYDED